jgi:hypothetical protein
MKDESEEGKKGVGQRKGSGNGTSSIPNWTPLLSEIDVNR